MKASERLAEVFERGQQQGFASLTAPERDLWLIQDFIIEHGGGGLSGYFYNRLPDLDHIRATVDAMSRYGLTRLAGMLNEALGLFDGYVDPDPPTTWNGVLRRYDPANRLDALSGQIYGLSGYGVAESTIA